MRKIEIGLGWELQIHPAPEGKRFQYAHLHSDGFGYAVDASYYKDTPAAHFMMPDAGVDTLTFMVANEDEDKLRDIIIQELMRNPNAGIPSGAAIWRDAELFHGTDRSSAAAIRAEGVDISKSSGGYFGHGFYMADSEDLARSNYADFAEDDDEPGDVIGAKITDSSGILDMRNAQDAIRWQDLMSQAEKLRIRLSDPEFVSFAVSKGVSGVFDNSFGGLVIYNPDILDIQPEPDNQLSMSL